MPSRTPAKTTESRLCDAIDRLVELQRSIFMEQSKQNKDILDRALQVADWGLRVRNVELETNLAAGRPINPRRVEDPATPYRENGHVPAPDITVDSPGRTSFD